MTAPLPAIPQLAEFATGLRTAVLPQDVTEIAARILADAVACATFGARFSWSRAVRHQTGLPPEPALPFGTNAPGARRAEALVWGVQAHAFELDSLRKPGAGVHPGATVALPALSVARALGQSGDALLRAIVAGCEVMYRIGAATLHTPEMRGIHAPGLTGPFGAAVAAGVLMGLDSRQLAHALGIAASMGGGLLAFSRSAQGGMVKRLHLGRAAEGGILAAELAAAGYEGPETALEGRFGLLEAYCDRSDSDPLTAGFGEVWEVRNTCFKLYACHVTAHPPVAALTALMAQLALTAADIAAIDLIVSAKVASHHSGRRPADLMQAQYSVPFMLATAAVRGIDDPRRLDDTLVKAPDVLAFSDRIALTEAGPDGPKGWDAVLTVHLRDGRNFDLSAIGFPGTPETPMDDSRLQAKFAMLTRDDIRDPNAAFCGLRSIGHLSDVSAVLAIITGRS
ncbi:MAG: MmgE/PrpD family protein [Cypionkella sp.]